jgi:hypothetical protein
MLRRSKIEEWVDEPFFNETLLNSFVKVCFNKKYIISEIKDIVEDENNMYPLTNGKKT